MKKISNLKLKQGAFLAPMADYTNIAFRSLCKEYGASLQYTELISCKSIIYNNKKTMRMLQVCEKEKPVFLQLFGNNPKDFSEAIKIVESKCSNNFAGFDINCGCSVPKAIKGKYGCYLMNYPELVGNIISEMKKVTKKPVTIKIRLGFEKENFLDFAKEVEKKGVDAICLHARLGKQGYSGKANWKKISVLKKQSKIPIIGNGDICSLEDYIKIKKETNCDFVMLGRGTIGNAFLFKQIKYYNLKKCFLKRTKKDILLEGKKYLNLAQKFGLEVNDIRGYFIGLSNNFVGAKKIRNEFALCKTKKQLEQVFEKNFG